jgi:hypothetical protein
MRTLMFFTLRTMSVMSSVTPSTGWNFVFRTLHGDPTHGRPLDRGEQHATQAVADRVAEAPFERLRR